MRWYIHVNGETAGPFDPSWIRQQYGQRTQWMICPEFGQEWTETSTLDDLSKVLCQGVDGPMLASPESVAQLLRAGILTPEALVMETAEGIPASEYAARATPIATISAPAKRPETFTESLAEYKPQLIVVGVLALVGLLLQIFVFSGGGEKPDDAAPVIAASQAAETGPVEPAFDFPIKDEYIVPDDLGILTTDSRLRLSNLPWTTTPVELGRHRVWRLHLENLRPEVKASLDSFRLTIPAGTPLQSEGYFGPVVLIAQSKTVRINPSRATGEEQFSVMAVSTSPNQWQFAAGNHFITGEAPPDDWDRIRSFLRAADAETASWEARQAGVWAIRADVTPAVIAEMKMRYSLGYVEISSSGRRDGFISAIISGRQIAEARGIIVMAGEDPGRFRLFAGGAGPSAPSRGQLVKSAVVPGHNVQVWAVTSGPARTGRYKVEMQHARTGAAGAFRIVVWADSNRDGIPDREIARSGLISAQEGEWSSFTFETSNAAIFVGNAWGDPRPTVYYDRNVAPGWDDALGTTVFYSRTAGGAPSLKASPRYTNIRFESLRR